jgi:RNA polymerase sigma-70 factor (ECF subfamily)
MGLSSEELMELCRRGETDAFNILVKRHQRRLIDYSDRIIIDEERAKELAQETFLKAFMARERYTPAAKFTVWLYRIALNLCRSELRRMKHRRTIPLYQSYSYPLSDGGEEETYELHETIPDTTIPSPDDVIEKIEREEMLKAAIESLPDKQREVLIMRVYDELEYGEIAQRLGCSVGTVKSRIHYGIDALKMKLRDRYASRESITPGCYAAPSSPAVSPLFLPSSE